MKSKKKIYVILICFMLFTALVIPFFANGLLSYYSLINDSEDASQFVFLGSSITVYEFMQTTVIPFINAIVMFVILGIICFSVNCFGTARSIPFLIIGIISCFGVVVFSFAALCEAQDLDYYETYLSYLEIGYIPLLLSNVAISICVVALCFAVLLIVKAVRLKKDLPISEIYKDSTLYVTVLSLIPTFMNDIITTAEDLIDVGLPENVNEILYLCEPYLTLVIYAFAGYFTITGVILLFEKLCKKA